MDSLAHVIAFLQGSGPDIISAVLAVLGGLKVIARYTPFDWDDKALAAIESPFVYIASFLKKS